MKLTNWVVSNTFLLMLGAILGFVINLFIHGKLGYTMDETGPVYLQIIEYYIVTSLMIFLANLAAWTSLRKKFRISFLWIFAGIGGTLIGEILGGLVLWNMGINRANLGFVQGGAILPEIIIFMFSGSLIGVFQYLFFRKKFIKGEYWILACCIGWGLVPVVFYMFGGLAFGLITGITVTRLMKPRETGS